MWSGVLASTYTTVISLQQIPQLWSVFYLNRSMSKCQDSSEKSQIYNYKVSLLKENSNLCYGEIIYLYRQVTQYSVKYYIQCNTAPM